MPDKSGSEIICHMKQVRNVKSLQFDHQHGFRLQSSLILQNG